MTKEKALRIQRIYNCTRLFIVVAFITFIIIASVWI